MELTQTTETVRPEAQSPPDHLHKQLLNINERLIALFQTLCTCTFRQLRVQSDSKVAITCRTNLNNRKRQLKIK